MTFFMLSWFYLKYFWKLVKIANVAVFCKITCKIWILMHGMNLATLFLFFSYLKKKIKKFQKNFKLKNDNLEKGMQKFKFVIMDKIHHCA